MPAATAPNPLQRRGIDLVHQRLADVLQPWVGRRRVTVVMEGGSMYLSRMVESTGQRVLARLMGTPPLKSLREGYQLHEFQAICRSYR